MTVDHIIRADDGGCGLGKENRVLRQIRCRDFVKFHNVVAVIFADAEYIAAHTAQRRKNVQRIQGAGRDGAGLFILFQAVRQG